MIRQPYAIRLRFAKYFLVCFCAIYTSCSGPTPTQAGGGTYVENAIAGIIKDSNQVSAPNVEVTLFSYLYNPKIHDSIQYKQTALSKKDGSYIFTDVPAGKYQIIAVSPSKELSTLIPNLVLDHGKGIDSANGILNSPANLSISIAELNLSTQSYLYIPGTDISTPITSEALAKGIITIGKIPAGNYSTLYYNDQTGNNQVNLLTSQLQLAPKENIELDRFAFWQDTSKIYINTIWHGNATLGDVYHFPLLVRLDTSHFDFTVPRARDNLRFAKADGKTPIAFEVDNWDSTKQFAEIWLSIDTVYTNPAQYIYMYSNPVGNLAQNILKNPTSSQHVFDTSLGYASVFHFSENPVESSKQYKDETGMSSANLIDPNGNGSAALGVIHRSANLYGDSVYISTSKAFDNPQVFTVSLWIKTDDATGGSILSFGSSRTGLIGISDRHLYMDNNGYIHYGILPPIPDTLSSADSSLVVKNPDGIRRILSSVRPYNDNKWHLIVVVLGPDGQSLFMDGVREAFDLSSTEALNQTGYWRIGFDDVAKWDSTITDNHFSGFVDEFRVKTTADDYNHILLQYKSQIEYQNVIRME